MSPSTAADRRTCPRRATRAPVTLRVVGTPIQLGGRAVDLSSGGVKMAIRRRLPKGVRVHVELELLMPGDTYMAGADNGDGEADSVRTIGPVVSQFTSIPGIVERCDQAEDGSDYHHVAVRFVVRPAVHFDERLLGSYLSLVDQREQGVDLRMPSLLSEPVDAPA